MVIEIKKKEKVTKMISFLLVKKCTKYLIKGKSYVVLQAKYENGTNSLGLKSENVQHLKMSLNERCLTKMNK